MSEVFVKRLAEPRIRLRKKVARPLLTLLFGSSLVGSLVGEEPVDFVVQIKPIFERRLLTKIIEN